MGHFYAEIQGDRGSASRKGSKNSGMWCHIRGWNTGVDVTIRYDKEKDEDIVRVIRTGGSNGGTQEVIAEWTETQIRSMEEL